MSHQLNSRFSGKLTNYFQGLTRKLSIFVKNIIYLLNNDGNNINNLKNFIYRFTNKFFQKIFLKNMIVYLKREKK